MKKDILPLSLGRRIRPKSKRFKDWQEVECLFRFRTQIMAIGVLFYLTPRFEPME